LNITDPKFEDLLLIFLHFFLNIHYYNLGWYLIQKFINWIIIPNQYIITKIYAFLNQIIKNNRFNNKIITWNVKLSYFLVHFLPNQEFINFFIFILVHYQKLNVVFFFLVLVYVIIDVLFYQIYPLILLNFVLQLIDFLIMFFSIVISICVVYVFLIYVIF